MMFEEAPGTAARIRRYEPHDLAAVYDVCVRTADAGSDARGMYSSDDLMPDLFAGPYLYFEPELAFVLAHDARAVGYVIGTADTATFVRRYREEWIPRLADRYPVPPEPPATREETMLALHHFPERMVWAELTDYPAHLHIDLLPSFQRSGHGRALIETFLSAVAARGACGVHVCVAAENPRALVFYAKVGFVELLVPDPGPVVYLGRPTG
jgi:ribosomal protein S18 acetylase RimI-like enzyme